MSMQTSAKKIKREIPPCRAACPACINIQAYVALISQGKFREALEVIRRYIPFPLVCGRVCFAPCEDACTRSKVDENIGIRILKRFVADYELAIAKAEKPTLVPKIHEERVAIIGSGPAGLTAAYELAKMGYPVTVFEKSSELGGMLRECIPKFRLPKDILDIEIDYVKGIGIETQANTEIGKDVTIEELTKQGYKAVFLAIGAQKSMKLNIEGEELTGVIDAIEFLKAVNKNEKVELGDQVAVIGGGNVAIDVARTALRLGPKNVTIFYRRSRKEMPAHPHEVKEAEAEGVRIEFLVTPKRILGENGKVTAIELIRMELGPPDETGRRRPIPIEGSEFTVPVNSMIPAIGEIPDTTFLPKEISIARRNRIVVDPITLETTKPGIFAGGDAVTGPASVIEAIAAGKRAAVYIDQYLRGKPLKAIEEVETVEATWLSEEELKTVEKRPRQPMPTLNPYERVRNFKEVELGLSIKSALAEARRCLLCGPCEECLESEDFCEADDVIIDENKCTGCGTCVIVCPFGALEKDEKGVAKVFESICKSCGLCAASCPEKAITMSLFSDTNIITQALTILERRK